MWTIAGNVQFNRMHWHDSLEILCCIYGSFRINIQGTTLTMLPGDLVTINPNFHHEIFDGTDDGLQFVFSVEASMLRILKDEIFDFATIGERALPKDDPEICEVREDIIQLFFLLTSGGGTGASPLDSDEKWYLAHSLLHKVLMHLSKHKLSTQNLPSKTGMLGDFIKCVEAVHEQYDQPLSAARVANELGFSESTVYRLFRKYLGLSFVEYVNSVRISAVCGLLDKTDKSIIEIAETCGFSSLSNFYRVFNQLMGMTPREYSSYKDRNRWYEAGIQKDIMDLNRFTYYSDLVYTQEDIWNLILTWRKELS